MGHRFAATLYWQLESRTGAFQCSNGNFHHRRKPGCKPSCSGSHSCLCLQHFSDLATTFVIPAQVPRAAGSPECGSSRDRSRAQGWTCPLCAPAGRKIHRTQLTLPRAVSALPSLPLPLQEDEGPEPSWGCAPVPAHRSPVQAKPLAYF